MKIGLLAFSTDTGLGYQTRDFYRFMQPEKVLIADISKLNGMPVDHSWAFQPRVTDGLPSDEDCEWLVDGMDVVFVCETPLNDHLFKYARSKGVKTVLQYNYEFLSYLKNPEKPVPDILAAPSKWGIDHVREVNVAPVMHWPVPIDIDKFSFRRFEKLETFVHIIGRPAVHDRNGTAIFLQAAQRLRQFKYIIYLQRPREWRTSEHFVELEKLIAESKRIIGDNLEVVEDVADNREMYSRGEYLILPRRYGGLCLPMWEALSCGMPVIMPDVSPNDTILPKEWLVGGEFVGEFETRTTIKLFNASVNKLVDTMLSLPKRVSEDNYLARAIAKDMSWTFQREKYIERFQAIIGS